MEFDSLADTAAPRYAIESDDEDEPLSLRPTPDRLPCVDIRFVGHFPSGLPLVFASGYAGQAWARGAPLGEQKGEIRVDEQQVCLLFLPSWTPAAVLLSETHTRLPLSAMNPYSTAILDRMQPTSVVLLDSYSIQGYISSKVTLADNAPIRYLSTDDIPISDPRLEPFSPPNLLQSSTAALLSNSIYLAALNSKSSDGCRGGVLLLLPSAKSPYPPPSQVSSWSFLSHDEVRWDHNTMQNVHRWLFGVVDGANSPENWTETDDRSTPLSSASNRQRIGEGSMYI